MNDEYLQINVRLPLKLKEQVQEAAHSSKRTMAAEIGYRLEQTFEIDIEAARDTAKTIEFLFADTDRNLDKLISQLKSALKND
jgi:hypothetical protein